MHIFLMSEECKKKIASFEILTDLDNCFYFVWCMVRKNLLIKSCLSALPVLTSKCPLVLVLGGYPPFWVNGSRESEGVKMSVKENTLPCNIYISSNPEEADAGETSPMNTN